MFNKKLKRRIQELEAIKSILTHKIISLENEIAHWKNIDAEWKKLYHFQDKEFQDLTTKYQKAIAPKKKVAVKKSAKMKR